MKHPTVAILTALPLEYAAVHRHLANVQSHLHPRFGTRADLGELPGTPWSIALLELGEGSLTAAALTERVLSWFEPEAVLFVGIAGSLKDDIVIGDVVIATKVYGIHGGKQTPQGFLARPEAWRASHRLTQAARAALRNTPQTHMKPIATGDVVLASAQSALAAHLRAHYNDAAAIEMEGSGVASAVDLAGTDALVIRGISDQADADKALADRAGSQQRAAENAAAAAVAVLRELRPFKQQSDSTDESGDPGGGPQQGPTYGGDHLDFRDSTFNGPFVAKQLGRAREGGER